MRPEGGRRDDTGAVRGTGGVHIFRQLLRLYPRRFRDAYGEEMIRFFVQRLERARSAPRRFTVLRLWARTVIDVTKTAAAERRARPVPRDDSMKGGHPMSSFLHDVRYAARRLRRAPLFSVSAVAILAIGIGLNAAVFNLVDTALFRPPPFTDRESIVHIYQDSDGGEPESTSFPAYRDMAEATDVFAGVAATSPGDATWEAVDGPRTASIEFATASYFPVLGLATSRGRWFAPEHDRVGAAMVAVVTHRAWRTHMGSDPDVIGRTIRLNNQPVTIIGVGPERFNGEAGAMLIDFWLSISSTPVGGPFRVANLDRRTDHWYQVKARLAPAVTVARAQAAMDVLARRLADAFPELNEGRDITVFAHDDVRFDPSSDGELATAGVSVLVLAGLVLLLACSNLANLLLVRGVSMGPEMAVRRALGAGRNRVARLLVLEALLLAMSGGIAGLALAAWSVRLVPMLPLPLSGAELDIGFDHRVVVFGILVALAAGLLFGIMPALRTARTDVAAALRDEARGQSAGRGVTIMRGGLVALQVAISMVLVVAAGLLARSLANAARVDPGVDVDPIAVLETNLQQGGVADGEAAVVVTQLLERINALPGVERAALTTRLPVQSGGTTTRVVDGYEPVAGTSSVELPFAFVSRDYFETMGIRVIAGRTFTADDRPESPTVIVVNEAAARAFWDGNAVGGRIRSQGDDDAWDQVVGVVADVKVTALQEPPTPMIYFSADQYVGSRAVAIVTRTAGDPAALNGALRNTLREVRASLPVTRLITLEAHLGEALAGPRVAAVLIGGFSLLALLLASLGVYAVVAFTVERRTQELGIRLALGATRARIIGMVLAKALLVVALGVAAGLALVLPAMRGLERLLAQETVDAIGPSAADVVFFGVGPVDAVTFTQATLLLLVAAAAAAFVPALRAARADPVEALRSR